jgi:hypothetical protein
MKKIRTNRPSRWRTIQIRRGEKMSVSQFGRVMMISWGNFLNGSLTG